jgi:hypothetical protein
MLKNKRRILTNPLIEAYCHMYFDFDSCSRLITLEMIRETQCQDSIARNLLMRGAYDVVNFCVVLGY